MAKEWTIEEYTSVDPVTVSPETPVSEVVRLLGKHGFRHIPVVRSGRAVGIISDRDVLLPRSGTVSHLVARDVMTENPYSVPLDAPLEEVALELSRQKFGSAVVYDRDGRLFGIFTATDALNALVELLRAA
jgi:acetoin utilization protein AcuB